jgi:hypothetical protein
MKTISAPPNIGTFRTQQHYAATARIDGNGEAHKGFRAGSATLIVGICHGLVIDFVRNVSIHENFTPAIAPSLNEAVLIQRLVNKTVFRPASETTRWLHDPRAVSARADAKFLRTHPSEHYKDPEGDYLSGYRRYGLSANVIGTIASADGFTDFITEEFTRLNDDNSWPVNYVMHFPKHVIGIAFSHKGCATYNPNDGKIKVWKGAEVLDANKCGSSVNVHFSMLFNDLALYEAALHNCCTVVRVGY